jgi:hypothetical protein
MSPNTESLKSMVRDSPEMWKLIQSWNWFANLLANFKQTGNADVGCFDTLDWTRYVTNLHREEIDDFMNFICYSLSFIPVSTFRVWLHLLAWARALKPDLSPFSDHISGETYLLWRFLGTWFFGC